MPTLTIRNLSEETITAIKQAARRNDRSMEKEAREFLRLHYTNRGALLRELAESRKRQSRPTTAEEVEAWIAAGR